MGELAGYLDPSRPRRYAYQFSGPRLLTETVEIALPEGFKVDELPEPVNSAFSFGSYSSRTEAAGNVLRYKREYRVSATMVPADRISELIKLFSAINQDEKSMAILKRGN